MKKSILNLNGVLELTKIEQKSINGGIRPRKCTQDRNVPCNSNSECLSGEGCYVLEGDINAPVFAVCQCLR